MHHSSTGMDAHDFYRSVSKVQSPWPHPLKSPAVNTPMGIVRSTGRQGLCQA